MALYEKVAALANSVPELRQHLVPLLKEAMEFPTEDALKDYLEKHPDADRSKHTVKQKKDEARKPDEGVAKKLGISEEDMAALSNKAKRSFPNSVAFKHLFPKAKGFSFTDLDYASNYSDADLKSEFGISRDDLNKYRELTRHLMKAKKRKS
jgi:hypothetical protein